MNDRQQTRFEERLNQIIGAEDSVSKALDALDDEVPNSNLPTVVEYDDVPSKVVATEAMPADLLDDYVFSRKILYGLINRGIVALEGATIVARESEHPRAFEVVASIMNNVSSMTKDLLDLQKPLSSAPGKQVIAKQVNIQQNFGDGTAPGSIKDINNLLDSLDEA